MSVEYWLIASLATSLIAFSKAGFGGGPGVLATPLMLFVCEPKMAIAIMLPIMIFCDIWCVIIYGRNCVWGKVFNLLSGFIIGMVIATFLLAGISGQEIWLRKGIGALVVIFGLLYFLFFKNEKIEKYVPQNWWFGFIMGIIAGITSTLAHAASPLTAMYFLSQGQKKDDFMGSIVVYCLIGNSLKIPSYLLTGIMTEQTLSLTWPLLIIVPIVIAVGWYLNKRLSDISFKGWINAILIGIDLYLIVV